MVGDQDLVLCEIGFGCQRELMKIASKDPKTFFPAVYRDMAFKMDWFDFLTVPGTLKSLLQHHSSKESFLQCSALFLFQLSNAQLQVFFRKSEKIKDSDLDEGEW